MATWSDRTWNVLLNSEGSSTTITKFTVESLEAHMGKGFYLANLFKKGDEDGNKTRTEEFIKTLLVGGDPHRLWSCSEALRPHGSYQFACLKPKVSEALFNISHY